MQPAAEHPGDTSTAVGRFLAGITAGELPDGLFADDAVLDATVPNWRFSVRGGSEVRGQLAGWFADPGQFDALSRTPIAGGELVEFVLRWTEHDVVHSCHQAHILRVDDGRIASDTAFCGGRWPAPLMAEMEQAQQAG